MYPGSISSFINGGCSIVYGDSVVYHTVEPEESYNAEAYGLSRWVGRPKGKYTVLCSEVNPVAKSVLVRRSFGGVYAVGDPSSVVQL